jgi:hypothetical protein
MTGIITAILCGMVAFRLGEWAIKKAKEIKKRFKK